jgi:outer membrane protein
MQRKIKFYNMKKIKIYILFIIYFLFHSATSFAQEKLELEQAIKIALENNYSIRISRNTSEIATTNAKGAVSYLLPVVSGDFSTNKTIQNTELTQQSGAVSNIDGAVSTNTNYGVALNWKIFDGFEMFANYDRLKAFEKLGELNAKVQVQNTISDVISTYYDLVKKQQELEATSTALEISRIRMQNAESRYTIGKGSRLEVLAAQVDLNTDTTNLLRKRDEYRTSMIRLNETLARDINTNFNVSDSIRIDESLQLEQLKTYIESQNPDMQTAMINQRLAKLNLKAVKANRYPDINFTSGYNFNNSSSETGFIREQKAQGLNYGLNASINIFNGFYQNRSEKAAKLEFDNSSYALERTQLNIQAQLQSDYQNYLTNLQLVKLEAANVNVAKQNLDISLEKYKLGSIVPLELRVAQQNYVDAITRYTDAQYQAKTAEIQLKQLTGTLIGL